MITPRPFELHIDGATLFCLAFPTGEARTAALAGAAQGPVEVPAPPAVEDEPRPRGRPSCHFVLAAAVSALRLDPRLSIAQRRRLVLKYLAQSASDPSDIPGRTTVEDYLRTHPIAEEPAEKSPEKWPEKSVGRKVSTTGG